MSDDDDNRRGQAPSAREINETIRYTVWTVFARTGDPLDADPDVAAKELQAVGRQPRRARHRRARHLRRLRPARRRRPHAVAARPHRRGAAAGSARVPPHRRRIGSTEMVWSAMAMHRPAEFNRGHVPAFMLGQGAAGVAVRLPVRALLRVVPAPRGGAPAHAHRARHEGPRLRGRALQHRRVVRPRRLRVGARPGVARAARPRRHDARHALHRRASSRARGDPVLHRVAESTSPAPSTSCDDRCVRRRPARLLRRSGGSRRGRPVPRAGHGRPRHPARAPARGRAALPDARRGEPHQRAEPRAARRAAPASWPAAASTCPVVLAQPQLRARSSPTSCATSQADGHRRVLAVATSAYSSYSGCRQYREDLRQGARHEAGSRR